MTAAAISGGRCDTTLPDLREGRLATIVAFLERQITRREIMLHECLTVETVSAAKTSKESSTASAAAAAAAWAASAAENVACVQSAKYGEKGNLIIFGTNSHLCVASNHLHSKNHSFYIFDIRDSSLRKKCHCAKSRNSSVTVPVISFFFFSLIFFFTLRLFNDDHRRFRYNTTV